MGAASDGRSSADCISTNNPIVLRTCTVEAVNTELSVTVPCMFSIIVHTATCMHDAVFHLEGGGALGYPPQDQIPPPLPYKKS